MDNFTLTIKMGNDAMQTADDVSAALSEAASDVVRGAWPTGFIYDANGNRVGEWSVGA